MRVAIREQLALLVLFAVLLALTIVAVPTWIYVNNHIAVNLREGLALTASLKAARITADLELIQTSCFTISSRVLLQDALTRFYLQNSPDWERAANDIKSALAVGASTGLLQARVYSRNSTGGEPTGLLNVTAPNVPEVLLPYRDENGDKIHLNNTPFGYPPMLYPNITYENLNRQNKVRHNTTAFAANAFSEVQILANNPLLLGPLVINETAALLSVTIPIRDNLDTFVLGYMTIVSMASSLVEVRDSREGLSKSGMVLLVGPTNPWNRFNASNLPTNATHQANKEEFGNLDVQFVLPPKTPDGTADRHSDRQYKEGATADTFKVKDYPAVFDSFVDHYNTVNNASAMLDTHNEQGMKVAVGFARTQTPLVNWTVIVEKSRSEAYAPIAILRNILLGTVFGTAGFIMLVVWPCAHLGVMPIRKLKAATEKSVNPPGYDDSMIGSDSEDEAPASGGTSRRSKKGFVANVARMLKRKGRKPDSHRDVARRMFKIPGKVDDRKHFITDELTELTRTFNDMSDELVKQYMSLDEKVAERTRELEDSKKAAEAANESKTLFIANISHELKTPLNGIMGMCAVLMEDNDIARIKQSLKVVYNFSKNQIGQPLNLELKEFRLGDVRSQIISIFDKQVREGRINFSVNFLGSDDNDLGSALNGSTDFSKLPALGPTGAGRLKDMCLWGDQHRILQVIINLVSNSLKFTPPDGRVEVRIKCLGEHEVPPEEESRASSMSKHSRTGRTRHRSAPGSTHSGSSGGKGPGSALTGVGTALTINPMDPKATPHVQVRERSPTPPPSTAKSYMFEFEVQDTGPGIPEDMQQKVFEPFVQVVSGLSKQFGGTGLGLSICQQLAGLMGGSITLRSTLGVGTIFTMRIPLKYVQDRASSTASSSVKSRPPSVDASEPENLRLAAATPAKVTPAIGAQPANIQPRLVGLSQPYFAADHPAKPKSTEEKMAEIGRAMVKKDEQGKLRVLVADDNSTNIEVVSRMLKLEEVYDVTVAKDGQEAFDLVKATMALNQSFDVIFMDVQMPKVDGLQSTRLIREMGYTSPIVALTAFSEESNVRECINSGMDEFLAKPIRRPALKQVLKKFATIPEEPETASLATRRTSPERSTGSTSTTASQQESDCEKREPTVDISVNGKTDKVQKSQ
ncbi:hypothetical protein NLU13_4488 [Sarocladium strictum]|uniref:histidine kinase n=1 Tax=Sarocladium strictum TaxID=5046 RepID=A0AA39GKC1_SARSR|nr:hypothetical protein NLU13_4488 [Sarocladium strictum]